MLVFNKEFRQGEKLISEIRKKIKKSKNLELKYDDGLEVYSFDTFDVIFSTVISETFFKVVDKSGKEIVSMDCTYKNDDELAKVRFNRFSHLLDFIRTQDKIRKAKSEKFKQASEKADHKRESAQAQKTLKRTQEKMLSDALDKIRQL